MGGEDSTCLGIFVVHLGFFYPSKQGRVDRSSGSFSLNTMLQDAGQVANQSYWLVSGGWNHAFDWKVLHPISCHLLLATGCTLGTTNSAWHLQRSGMADQLHSRAASPVVGRVTGGLRGDRCQHQHRGHRGPFDRHVFLGPVQDFPQQPSLLSPEPSGRFLQRHGRAERCHGTGKGVAQSLAAQWFADEPSHCCFS
eukprot:s1836_g18.t1